MLQSEGFSVIRTETAGRHFSVRTLVERGRQLNKPLFDLLERLSARLRIQDKMVYVDPRYKMTVYAAKPA